MDLLLVTVSGSTKAQPLSMRASYYRRSSVLTPEDMTMMEN